MSKGAGKFTYPQFAWHHSGWWFTVLGAFAGIVVILYPDMMSLKFAHRVAIACSLAILPCLMVVLAYLSKVISVFCCRATNFDALLIENTRLEQKLESTQFTIGMFTQERANRNAYHIDFCYTYESRSFICLRKKRGPGISIGQQITVIDTQTGAVMGHCSVVRQTDEHYYCEINGYVDALWLGNIKQNGSQHSEAPPEALALAIVSNTTGDNDG